NCWLGAVAVLYAQGNVEFAMGLAADLLLRIAVIGSWSIGCLGMPYVIIWCWRHRRSPRPRFAFGRWWFSAVVVLVAAEPVMSLWDREHEAVAFPERLSDPPEGELRIALIGSSTMFGHPYDPKFGIAQVLAWRLQQMYPHRRVVTENLAIPGICLKDEIH